MITVLKAAKNFVKHIEDLPDDTEKCRILKMSLNNRPGEKLIEAIAKAEGKKRYFNISEKWGDPVEVTPEDYKDQAAVFGVAEPEVEEREDGLYIDGEQVAEVVED